MKTKLIPGVVFLLFVTLSSFAQVGGMKADGKADEWSKPLRYSKSGSGISYDITNDSSKLYIVLQSSDPVAILRLVHCGFEFYIDTTGKKKKTVAITFPMGHEDGWSPTEKRNEEGTAEQQVRFRIERDGKVLKAIGLRGLEKGEIALPNDKGIDAALALENAEGVLTIELGIPMRYLKAIADTNTEWSIGMKLNVARRPEGSSTIMGGPGGNRNGVDGPSGGALSGTGAAGTSSGFPQQQQGQPAMPDDTPAGEDGKPQMQAQQGFYEIMEWRFKIKLNP